MYTIRRIIAVLQKSFQLSVKLLGLIAIQINIYYKSKAVIKLT
jgi:hypothetical protein